MQQIESIWYQGLNRYQQKLSSRDLLAIEMKVTKIIMSKPFYLYLSGIEKIQIVIYNIWYDYLKLKKREKVNYFMWIN